VVTFTELRVGAPVDILFDETGTMNFVNQVTVAPVEVVEGTVVQVLEPQNLVVVRTVANQEVSFFVEKQTTFLFHNQVATLADFKPGIPVRVHFELMNQKHMAHSIMSLPKSPK
jgi:hypothetical protein